jgi:KDO2-lipid IV(A) lauroyltransferase
MRSLLISLLLRWLGWLPLPVSRALGRGVGTLLYRLPNREQATARVNLSLCFPELADAERERLLRQTLRENATTILEMPAAWRRGSDFWRARIDVQPGLTEAIRERLALGRGLIYAAPHLGNWEVGLHYLTSLGPTTAFYRPPRESAVEDFMLSGRRRAGAKLAAITSQGIRALYQALSAGEQIAVLPDQQPKRAGASGAFGAFFGVPALTMTLLARLARKSQAPVLFIYAARMPDGRFCMHGMPASAAVASADPEEAVTALNADIERCVRLFPAQYQWTYRRFLAQPQGGRHPYKTRR